MATTPEIEITSALVARLVRAQFPRWADLPITPVVPGGWDNRTFRLGRERSVRLPSAARYAGQVEKEQRWLPHLAARVPLPIPTPIAMGMPQFDYPWTWSVFDWIVGERARIEAIADVTAFATELATFLAALHGVDAVHGPAAGPHNFHRGGALGTYDDETRTAIDALAGEIDQGVVRAIWDRALDSTWTEKPVWVHGDMSGDNLLVVDGRLAAVIDFGTMGVGDPACDLTIAWTLLPVDAHAAFRRAIPLDAATWDRARGWALWKALTTLAARASHASRARPLARRVLNRITNEVRPRRPLP